MKFFSIYIISLLLSQKITASELISVEDLLPVTKKQALGIRGNNETIPILPSLLHLSEQRRSFNDRNLKLKVEVKEGAHDKFLFAGAQIGAGFFRYRHLWWVDTKKRLIAEASIRWLKTVRVFDYEGSYLGIIHRVDSDNQQQETYNLLNRQGELIAVANQLSKQQNHSELFLTYLQSDESGKRFGSLVAHLKNSKNASSNSGKTPLASWQIDVKEGQMDLIGTGQRQIDPRLIMFIAPFSLFWDRGSALDE